MNEKSIRADLDEKTKKMHRDQQANEEARARQEKWDARYERRNKKPYDLALRNRELYRKAKALKTPLSQPHRFSSAIILGDSPPSELTPNHVLICRLTEKTASYSSIHHLDFDFFHIRKSHSSLQSIRRAGQFEKLIVSEFLAPDMTILKDGNESTYKIASNIYEDEILEELAKNVSARLIEPISVIRRPIKTAAIGQRLDHLGETVAMLEAAATNSQLNPFLSGILEKNKIALGLN